MASEPARRRGSFGGRMWAAWGEVRRLVRSCASAGVDLLYPPRCALCGAEMLITPDEPLLCKKCQLGFTRPAGAVCRRCAAPLPGGGAGTNCPFCRTRSYHFQAALALGVYTGNLREAVLRMKLAFHEPLTRAMGALLADQMRSRFSDPSWADPPLDLLVPVPMHWTRQLLRGVNCPKLLVESLAPRLGLPAADRLLMCRRKTKKQGTLAPAERFRNVRGAFVVSSGYDITDAHVLLVDDVMTTGATASEAAKALRKSGAARVSVAVVARGVGPGQRVPSSGPGAA